MVCVPGGVFRRGTDNVHRCAQGENRSQKTHFGPSAEVFVETFLMDETEVTIAAYKACMASKACPKDGPRYNDFSRPNQPVTATSWFNARTLCRSQGKRLPSEVEWERAARGPADDDGIGVDAVLPACPNVIVMDPKQGRSCGTPKKGSHPEKGRVLEVKSAPPGPWGLYEMRGNAEEWVDDWFVADLSACPQCQGMNPRGPCADEDTCKTSKKKMVKGGSWYWPGEHATSWHRRPWQPSNKPPHHFGFRCAQSLLDAAAVDVTPAPR